MKLILVDLNSDLIDAWTALLDKNEHVLIAHGSIFEADCDALVSPANSYGFMDGGLDLAISRYFGWHVQERLQQQIRHKHFGELLVGTAEIVETDHESIPYVISAPTMRVPMILTESANVFLAMRAVLLLIKHGRFEGGEKISGTVDKVAVPGMGTGVGRIPPEICARQMKAAIDEVMAEKRPFPASWHEAQARHQLLYSEKARDIQLP